MLAPSQVPYPGQGISDPVYPASIPVSDKEYPNITGTTMQPSGPGIIPSVTSTLTGLVPQALSGVSQAATTIAQPVTNIAWSLSSWILTTIGYYWNQYPTLRAFSYTLGALTFIPISIFTAYAAISATIIGGIALVGVTLVEGGILGFGLLFLGPVLFFSFWGALIGTGLISLTIYGLRFIGSAISTIQQTTGYRANTGIVGSTMDVAKNASVAAADLASKAEALMIGPRGVPEPLYNRV